MSLNLNQMTTRTTSSDQNQDGYRAPFNNVRGAAPADVSRDKGIAPVFGVASHHRSASLASTRVINSISGSLKASNGARAADGPMETGNGD